MFVREIPKSTIIQGHLGPRGQSTARRERGKEPRSCRRPACTWASLAVLPQFGMWLRGCGWVLLVAHGLLLGQCEHNRTLCVGNLAFAPRWCTWELALRRERKFIVKKPTKGEMIIESTEYHVSKDVFEALLEGYGSQWGKRTIGRPKINP